MKNEVIGVIHTTQAVVSYVSIHYVSIIHSYCINNE